MLKEECAASQSKCEAAEEQLKQMQQERDRLQELLDAARDRVGELQEELVQQKQVEQQLGNSLVEVGGLFLQRLSEFFCYYI